MKLRYILIPMLIYGTAIVFQQVKIADLRQALADLRADAERVNYEVICCRYLLNEYEPAPQAVEDCKGIGVDITPEPSALDKVWGAANGTTTYRFIGEEPHERPQSHP